MKVVLFVRTFCTFSVLFSCFFLKCLRSIRQSESYPWRPIYSGLISFKCVSLLQSHLPFTLHDSQYFVSTPGTTPFPLAVISPSLGFLQSVQCLLSPSSDVCTYLLLFVSINWLTFNMIFWHVCGRESVLSLFSLTDERSWEVSSGHS